jgi:succinate-acetate transporter protein
MASMTHQHSGNGVAAEIADWRASTRIFLQPIAAPSILGLYGFAAATFMVAAHLAGWYGNANTPLYLAPFAAMFGGLAQFIAGIVAFRARDGLATAMHGMWGSFWLAYGILQLLVAVKAVTVPAEGQAFTELGYWFLTLAAITAVGFIAATAENLGLSAVLLTLAVGSGLLAVGYLVGGTGWTHTGGWVLIASAILAWYSASAMMLASTFGRTVLPTGRMRKTANVPGKAPLVPIEFELGEPGVHMGQ